jgi:hypothetical protein
MNAQKSLWSTSKLRPLRAGEALPLGTVVDLINNPMPGRVYRFAGWERYGRAWFALLDAGDADGRQYVADVERVRVRVEEV